MAAFLSKEEYLKRYLSAGSDAKEDKPKKKRKKVKVTGQKTVQPRVKIVDDDVDFNSLLPENLANTLEDDVGDNEPIVAEFVDERPESVKQLELFRQDARWKTLGEDEQISDSDGSPSSAQTRRREHSGKHDSDSDISPVRHGNRDSESDNSLSNQAKGNKSRHDSDSDPSPPTRKRLDSDSDASPARRRRQDSDSDLSPARRGRRATSSHKKPDVSDTDKSPPRKKRWDADSDPSPPRRRKQVSDSDQSPPRMSRKKTTPDASPPRRGRNNSESDQSPPKRKKYKSDSDQSPPRRKPKDSNTDLSPPRKNPHSKTSTREGRSEKKHTSDAKSNADMDDRGRAKKTLSGQTAGLSSAKQMREEARKTKEREANLFKAIGDDMLGKNAATVFRQKGGGRRDVEKEEAEAAAKKAVKDAQYKKWGKGLKQQTAQDSNAADAIHEMGKSLTRHKDDKDMNDYLKQQEREGDPMLAFLKKKKTKKRGPELPRYKGPEPPPNRFNIWPGYRWDGVDRSSGFEKKIYMKTNERKATSALAYKWSTEDM